MNLRLRLGLEWLLIALLASAIVGAVVLTRSVSGFDNLLYDRASALQSAEPDSSILLVSIDDSSLAELGQWPWDRQIHAQALDRLRTAGARSVLLDILLSEESNATGDAELAEAIARAPPTYLPMHFASPGSNGRAYDTVLPAKGLANAATGLGHVNLVFDHDGIVRKAELCFKTEPNAPAWPHIVERVYRGSGKKASPAFTRQSRCGEHLLIPFARNGSFTEIPYARLLAGEVPDSAIRGRDIIIGATAAGLGDNYPVANGGGVLMPGAEIMANMLTALRADNFIRQAGTAPTLLASILPLWLIMLAFLRWRPRNALVISLASLVALFLGSWLLLHAGIWLPPGAALLGVMLVYPLWGWRRLQAMSDFMERELKDLARNDEIGLPIAREPANDLVGQQSAALSHAIDQLHGLRRFVSDILIDLPDPMLVTDLDGRIVASNQKLNERIGQSPVGSIYGETLAHRVSPETREAIAQYYQRQEGDEKAETESEFVRLTDVDGQIFALRRAPLHGDDDRLIGHIHYFTDISDLARAEAEREEVLQLLSHDMRAPQSAIIAMLSGNIDAAAKKRIEHNARRTMALAQNFVDLARMGETPFEGEDVLFVDVVREAADNLWPLARERSIQINIEDESDEAFILAEPDTLLRALCNLMDNAIKFSPDKGVIDIFLFNDKGRIKTTIRDHGTGIAPEMLPHLFSRFATGGEHSGRVKGSGLGLTFVRAVIERHRGTVTAANVKNGGACFTISLPEAAKPED